jgi:hypothetical protein
MEEISLQIQILFSIGSIYHRADQISQLLWKFHKSLKIKEIHDLMGQFNRNVDDNIFNDQNELERLEDQINDVYKQHLKVHQMILQKLYQSMVPQGE